MTQKSRKLKAGKDEASKDLTVQRSGAYIVAPVSIYIFCPHFLLFQNLNSCQSFSTFYYFSSLILFISSLDAVFS